jgi:hypothetical protein
MKKVKSSVSKGKSYNEIGEFWDTHDLANYWTKTKAIRFDVDIQSEITYYSIDKKLSERLQSVARERGVSPDTLVNLWLQEKLQEQSF